MKQNPNLIGVRFLKTDFSLHNFKEHKMAIELHTITVACVIGFRFLK